MNKDEVIQKLIELKVIVQVKDEYYLIDKKLSVYNKGTKCKNLPQKFDTVSTKQAYQFFMDDCKIPHTFKQNIVYLLREETKESLNILEKILKDPTIDYNQLISKTKAYYMYITGPKPVKKYLSEGTWRAVYDAPILKSDNKEDYIDKM